MSTEDLLGRPLALVVALALVSLLPFVFMSMTAFVKISTVLQIVRSAIGAQSVPSSTVVMALSAALTVLAMAPVGEAMVDRARPLLASKKPPDTATLIREGVDVVREPLRAFLHTNSSTKERTRFLAVATRAEKARGAAPAPPGSPPVAAAEAVSENDLKVLVPSFVVTELTEAFAVGFLLYLPFLILDLVVANVLLALGMQMLSPTQVSLPFKLLLFVAIDGWGLLAEALVTGYR